MINKVETWEFPLTRWFDNLLNIPRVSKDIPVKGFSQIHEVTGQVFEDDILVHCSHANTHLEDITVYEGTEMERDVKLHVCDKDNCGYVFPIEESYHE